MHCRLGDPILLDHNTSVVDWQAIMEPWAHCALGLEASLGVLAREVKWLLVTDCAPLRSFAQNRYKDKVLIGSSEDIVHSKDQHIGSLDSAAIDNWLLGMTSVQVISEDSSFGRSAALRVNANASVFTVRQLGTYEHVASDRQVLFAKGVIRECRMERPDRIDNLLKAWWWL